ncbi:Telomerase protein component 1 [Pichia californica]|uniref:phosphatidylinositol-3,4,5-trisphosphate 3-phosphatase n=1 Tax=Pichia californica TaxID=460514 RepID=A0A9P6WN49_9ASCO|nr:Telomerase protein component 1 [[Candida] californica]KAG0690040.1 Telomerase protein component 1 [[Candida] californica]
MVDCNVPSTNSIHIDKNVDFHMILPKIGVGSYPVSHQLFGLSKDYSDLDIIIKALTSNFKKVLIIDLVAEEEPYYTIGIEEKGVLYQKINWVDYHTLALSDFINLIYKIVSFIKGNNCGVFIHCKHGKGRTGTLVCGLIMFSYSKTIDEANKIFAERRIVYKNGVQCISQLELLKYWWNIINNEDFRTNYIRLRAEITTKSWVIHEFYIDDNVGKHHMFEFRLANIKENSKEKCLKFKNLGTFGTNTHYYPNQIVDENICIEIEYSKTLLRKSFATFSFNIAMEWIMNKTAEINDDTISKYISWNQMSGIKGTRFKGKKYFYGIDIKIKRKLL